MKLSTIIKGSVCVLGLVGVGNFFAAPANAGDAAARAAATVSRADGITQTVSGEVVLPSGLYFGGIAPVAGTPPTPGVTLTVTPVIADKDTTKASLTSLSFDAGVATAVPTGGTIQAVVIDMLQGDNAPTGSATPSTALNATNIQDATAIIKAAGGASGLGGLE